MPCKSKHRVGVKKPVKKTYVQKKAKKQVVKKPVKKTYVQKKEKK